MQETVEPHSNRGRRTSILRSEPSRTELGNELKDSTLLEQRGPAQRDLQRAARPHGTEAGGMHGTEAGGMQIASRECQSKEDAQAHKTFSRQRG